MHRNSTSVGITNPVHYAVALKSEFDSMAVMKVVAKGMRKIAYKIRDIAEQHNFTITENQSLARALHKHVKVGERIVALASSYGIPVEEDLGFVEVLS